MIQEVITYSIIASAAYIAMSRMYYQIRGRKKSAKLKINKDTSYKKMTYTPAHNCSECIAECILRDALPNLRMENEELCETTVIRITKS